MLVEKIKKNLTEFVKSGKKTEISITRLLLAAIKDREITLRKNANIDEDISDSEVIDIVNKMIKQRNQTINTYLDAGRQDLAEKERLEAELLSIYLPKQLSEEDLISIVENTIKKIKADSIRDMGKVMNYLKKNYSGQCDFQKVSLIVKDRLSSKIN